LRVLICICCLFIPFSKGLTQYYNSTIPRPDNQIYDWLVLQDSVIYIMGLDKSTGVYKPYFVKFALDGSILSERTLLLNESGTYSVGRYQGAYFDGHLYHSVWNANSGINQSAFSKLTNEGDSVFYIMNSEMESNALRGVVNTLDSNLIYFGIIQFGSALADTYLIKTDTNGNILWTKNFGGSGTESPHSLSILPNGRMIIGGNTSSIGAGQTDAWMCLLDSAGNFISQRTFGYAYTDAGFSTVINSDTILFYGSIEYPPNPIVQKRVGFVILCDANLNFRDTFLLESPYDDGLNNFFGAVENMRNEYVLIGNVYDYSMSPQKSPIGHLICLDKSLNIKWERTFKARENDNYFTDISLMPDGGYIMSGYVFSDGAGTTQDGWLVRTNCLGWLSKPVPQFTAYNTGGNTVRFDNHSKFAEQFVWDFGDGWQYSHATSLQDSLSSIPYVEHTYTTPGTYTASLYAIACGDTMAFTQTVVADPLSVPQNNQPVVTLYPNPTGGDAFIESASLTNYHTLQVYNEAGQLVYSTTITAQATNRLEIPSSTWANGAYVVVLQGVERLEKLVLMKL